MKNLILLSALLITASIAPAAVNMTYAAGPTAVSDMYYYYEYPQSAIISILANDQPATGTRAAINPNSVLLRDQTGAFVKSVTRPGSGTLSVLMDGRVRFDSPLPSGEHLIFEYIVSDVNGAVSDVATIEVTTPILEPPMGDLTAFNDTCLYHDFPNAATFALLDNDPANGGDDSILDISSVHLIDPSTGLYSKSVTVSGYGIVNVLEDGKIKFEPQKQADTTLTLQYVFWDYFYMQRSNVATIELRLLKSLPVRLASFDASREGESTLLNWSTTEEINSERFEIQKSQDGKKWDPIGSVKASVESKATQKYNFHDTAPLTGQNMYRLKMIDQDGSFAFSSIKIIRFEEAQRLIAYPNPAKGRLSIRDYQNVKQVTIYNTAGAKVFESQDIRQEGINVAHFPDGMYTFSTTLLNGTVKTTKVAIAK